MSSKLTILCCRRPRVHLPTPSPTAPSCYSVGYGSTKWLNLFTVKRHRLNVIAIVIAPQYLVDCCKSTTQAASRQRLHSASRHQLIVPRHRRSSFGRQAFSVAGPMVWNSLPDFLRDTSHSKDTFRRSLKTYFFALY